jgi:hypothetical protein
MAACGVDEGTVTGKGYEAPYTYYVNTCTGYNAKGACTVWIPIPHTAPECWRLDLDDGENTGSECVSKQEYDYFGPGDFYTEGGR